MALGASLVAPSDNTNFLTGKEVISIGKSAMLTIRQRGVSLFGSPPFVV